MMDVTHRARPIELFANLVAGDISPGEFAADAERAGYDGVTCSDHYWLRELFPHVWVSLAEMACRTERVTVAPSFVNNLLRSPFEFVQASVAMHRSGRPSLRGRAGRRLDRTRDHRHRSGVSRRTRPARRFREALQIARQLFTTGSCQFEGEHYRMDVPEFAGLRVPAPPRGVGRRCVDDAQHHAARRPCRAEVRRLDPWRQAGHGHTGRRDAR